MPMQTWVSHIGGPGPGVAGTPLANSTTETDISPPGQGSTPGIVVPANMLNYIGAKLRITAFGVFSTTATPTLKLSLYPNAVAGANALTTTGAVTTANTVTNVPWRLHWEGVIRSIGTGGTIIGSGFCVLGTAVAAATFLPIPNTAIATTAINTTQNNNMTVAAQWGTPSASNTITCHDLSVLSIA
jgi:hypothetical protein